LNNRVAIVAAKRTPIGAFQGSLSHLKSPELGSAVISSLLQETSVDSSALSEVILGCVLSAGVGQAPARQAAGMKALMLGCDHILLNQETIVIAGGMESMSNSPYLLDRARSGYRLGHNRLIDHMWIDGLEDAYQVNPDKSRKLMGDFAEATAIFKRGSR
jgi:acetyl-CoA C-acetyltransferase